mmetsp:Transcript_41791/g.87722  ORF Transcript_41791/g.87722 Transcript_41791/m.87722 type:complete len:96 (+) Transcript_41791:3203-3490(+)
MHVEGASEGEYDGMFVGAEEGHLLVDGANDTLGASLGTCDATPLPKETSCPAIDTPNPTANPTTRTTTITAIAIKILVLLCFCHGKSGSACTSIT